MDVGVAHTEHPEARELVASAHCLLRFRERMPVRVPGGATPAALLRETLEEAHVSAWPPGWAVSDRPAELWAATAELAFPLARTPAPGRWLAVTCLRRGAPVSDHLADMRRSYERGGLDEAELAATWHEQFERWLADAVAGGITEPNAMTLATVSAGGAPSARTVLLKGLDARGLVLYTNLDSRKATELAATGRAALTFGWIDLQRQVCVTGDVEPVSAAESDAYFASRPRGSQLGAHASPQSTVVGSRAELEERLAAAEARWPEGAPVPRPERWGGLRVVPDAVEFWQGRPNRLHDRLRFRRDGSAWVVERLAP